MHLFVSGTGTGVGKTHVTRLLLLALQKLGRSAVAYKPVCCGNRDDAKTLLAAGTPGPSIDEINPVWLKTPAAPGVAARLENRPIDRAALLSGFQKLAARFDHVIVEGVGGWAVPLTDDSEMADLATDLNLPVLVVVDNRLGALNHTALTVRAIRACGLHCAGLVLNHLEDERDIASVSNRSVLEDWLKIPVLEDILHGATETSPEWVANLFPPVAK